MLRRKLQWVWVGALLLGAVSAFAGSRITGLKNPESVVSGGDGRIYVSEIGELDRDGDGIIRVIDKSRKSRVFAQGMNDPKGLAFSGNTLYVADKNRVLKVAPDGTWKVLAPDKAFPVPPVFLNDLEADCCGNLYVSDSGDLKGNGGAIYRVASDGRVTLVVDAKKDARIKVPNGLLMSGEDGLLVVDFMSGILYRINLNNAKLTRVADSFGAGDGLVRVRGNIYVSDWKGGRVLEVNSLGEVKIVKDGYRAAADIGLSPDKRYLLVPDMTAGELDWVPIP